MRIERTYRLERVGRDGQSERADFLVYCDEKHFCEDPECIAQHEDPAILWDTRSSYVMCEAYGRERGQRIIDGLQGADRVTAALRNLREAAIPAYQSGRIEALAFVAAGNVLSDGRS